MQEVVSMSVSSKVLYPFLEKYSNSIDQYIPPDYYDSLLKEYRFDKKLDLDYFDDFIKDNLDKKLEAVLELGVGSARVTDNFLSFSDVNSLDLVDLSDDMVVEAKRKYEKHANINVYKNDNLDYMKKTNKKYDFVYTLWSLSHSIHQHLIDRGNTENYVEEIIKKFVTNNMNPGSKFFLIHFDSLSEEQKILMRQWKKYFPIFENGPNKQSPSKLILDKVFNLLSGKEIKNLKIDHLVGDPIEYDSIENALEIFMNFHMETEFNRHTDLDKIVSELLEDINKYKKLSDGKYCIKPGCFIYTFEKT